MKNQNTFNTIYRFELKTNSYQRAYNKAFSIYGILIIPKLVGGILMYNVFELRGNYFFVPLVMLGVVLVNLYVYYQHTNRKNNRVLLMIQNDYLQLMDIHQIYFESRIDNIQLEKIRCGKSLQPAMKLQGEDFNIIIGLENSDDDDFTTAKHQLCQPDYWLSDKQQVKRLVGLIGKIKPKYQIV